MRIATIQQYAVFTKYLTLLSFESFHIDLVREMFTPRQTLWPAVQPPLHSTI
jgi:hypothetical protein